ncbi:acyltransferase family protein [Porphyromonas sp. COT-290 OH3588]|uniref:acyltransferase family protein n=1 Tax=Porphyromonas sp. COT-290 OH3588 TaxID=1515617 RepID=UPI00350FF160
MSKISKLDSTLITNVRFPLLLLVILSHCVIIRTTTPASFALNGENIFHMTELISRSLGAVAVGGFAIISGYLFFLFPPKRYLDLLKVKAQSLLLPYILWVLISILAVWAKNQIALQIGFAPGISDVEISTLNRLSILELMILPFNGPLWYIRELIYLVVLSPIIGLLLRYTKVAFPIVMGVIYLLGVQIGVSNSISFYFVVGAWLGYTGRSLAGSLQIPTYLSLINLMAYLYIVLFLGDYPWYSTIYGISSMVLVASIFSLVQKLTGNEAFSCAMASLAPSVFFVYASHAIIFINLFRGFGYASPLGASPWGHILIQWLTAILTTISAYLLYRISSRFFPRVTALLCGGRA